MTVDELTAAIGNLASLSRITSTIDFQDADRNTFRDELLLLTDKVINTAIPSNSTFFNFLENAVKLASIWNKLLKESKGFRLCDEMKFCIESMIAEWDPASKEKIVVFTLGDYAVNKQKKDRYSKLVEILIAISNVYNVKFSKEPVFILVPDEFKNETLANIVLFHEVGHFVDHENALNDYVFEDVDSEIQGNPKARILREYFPMLYDKPFTSQTADILRSHIEEYLADVFGAIYSHSHILDYLDYLRGHIPNAHDEEHPSLNCRRKVVNAFISYCRRGCTSDHLLQYIINAMEGVTGKTIKLIEPQFTNDQYLNANIRLSTIQEMHSMFVTPWDMLLEERKRLRLRSYPVEEYHKLRDSQLYKDLDKAIKDAISTL